MTVHVGYREVPALLTVQSVRDTIELTAEAMRDIKLPKYEKWANYDACLPMNIERYCDFYSLGI